MTSKKVKTVEICSGAQDGIKILLIHSSKFTAPEGGRWRLTAFVMLVYEIHYYYQYHRVLIQLPSGNNPRNTRTRDARVRTLSQIAPYIYRRDHGRFFHTCTAAHTTRADYVLGIFGHADTRNIRAGSGRRSSDTAQALVLCIYNFSCFCKCYIHSLCCSILVLCCSWHQSNTTICL